MIIYMSDILCVTNRSLCEEDFFVRMEKIAKAQPKAIILREKDLSEEEYLILAREVMQICQKYSVPCVLHSFVAVAKELMCTAIHLPLPLLRALSEKERSTFTTLGASCHSVSEAKEAERLGCTYIIAGHIFETDCKKGMEGRGITFLSEVCASVAIPVYAIGGIDEANIAKVRRAGASGACVMSSIMACDEPNACLQKLNNAVAEL